MDPSPEASRVAVVPYAPEYRHDFERLNRQWIEEFFSLEEADREIFADPFGKVVAPGGQIFFVLEEGEAKGTCAVLRRDSGTYELAKMAVASSARGRGYGDRLMRAALEFSRMAGAREIVLSSNTKLGVALRLYEKYGFQKEPHTADERYQRVDIRMRLVLPVSHRPAQ